MSHGGAFDPVVYVKEMERAWQAHDAEAAAAVYTDDAVQIYGCGQQRSGAELRAWPREWFTFAADLHIEKTFRAYSDGVLVSEWKSRYTHPVTGKTMLERGAEVFFVRGDKVYRHHMFEHSWKDGDESVHRWPAV